MTAGQDSPQTSGGLPQRLARARRQARRALWAERLWPLMLPAADTAMGIALLGLTRLPQHLPDSLHAILLAGCIAGVGHATWRQWRGIRRPTPAETDRRVEQASGLSGQPLRTLQDRPASPTPETGYLWQLHLNRIMAGMGPLRGVAAAAPAGRTMVGRDAGPGRTAGRWAGVERQPCPSRIMAAFLPGVDDSDTPVPQINAWITLPDYAPGAPVFLDAAHDSADVPAGAQLSVTLNGLDGRPVLRARASMGPHGFHALGNGSWTMQATVLASGRLTLRGRGRTLARWTLHVTPNPAPDIAWGKDPGSREGMAHPPALSRSPALWHRVHPCRTGHARQPA
ncbi:DUF4175 family protein [Komagataeibacter rhaeticus]|nr:DUF4175 family protein [Komagataeibacter rhaeticus]